MANKETTAFQTDQEKFWAGDFGVEYISRNNDNKLIMNSIVRLSKILRSTSKVKSVLELGCNIGLNLSALRQINPSFELTAYEINEVAAKKAAERTGATIHNGTILEPLPDDTQHDLTFTSGVLIHINPDHLHKVYDNLFRLSRRYIMVCEYYNPVPTTVSYRGHSDRLFKRDFAGDLIDKYNLTLVDYGFEYHRDNYFPQDDLNWFLLEKSA